MTGFDDADMERRIEGALGETFDRDVVDAATLEKLGGHASMRVYWRIHLPTDAGAHRREAASEAVRDTLVAMVLAPSYDPTDSEEGPDEGGLAADVWPFVDVQQYFAGLGVPVPAIESVDRDREIILLEDLGDRTFGDACRQVLADDRDPSLRRRELEDLYDQALEALVDLQSALVESSRTQGPALTDECICWRRRLDRTELRWELDHYVDWGLEARDEVATLDAETRDRLDETFDRLVDELLEMEFIPVHRDFQSSNLMEHPRPDRDSRWVVIDFQDALLGPNVYDLVALLRDSYIELPVDLVSELLDRYIELGRDAELDWCRRPEDVRRAFHLQTIQRKLKDAGRFVNLDRTKGASAFLDYYEPSIGYVDAALERLSGWDELRETLHRLEPSLG